MSSKQCDEYELENMTLRNFLRLIAEEADATACSEVVANSRLRLCARYAAMALEMVSNHDE